MQFEAYATREAPIDGAKVQQLTFGSEHRFEVPAGTMTISLPAGRDSYEFREGIAARPDDPATSWYEFGPVRMRLDLIESIRYAGGEDEFNSNAVLQSAPANRACDEVEQALDDTFEIWKRTLRWTSLAPEIAIGDVMTRTSEISGWGYRIHRASDHKLFRGHGGRSSSIGGGKVSTDAWEAAGRALRQGVRPPLWYDYLFTAHRARIVGDLRSAITSAAIACETLVRTTLRAQLPEIESPIANRVIDTANIQGLLSRWPELTGQTKAEAKANGLSDTHALFDLRNELMHSGLSDPERLGLINRLIGGASAFVIAGDELLRAASGHEQRIYPAEHAKRRMLRKW